MPAKNKAYLLIAILAIIWGSSFILIKHALQVYTPFQIGAARMFVAFLVLFPFVFKYIRTVDKSKWKYFAISGFLGNGIPSVLFPLAQTKIDSALAGMINSLTPLFTFIVGLLFFGMRAGRNRVAGLTIGFIGAIILILGQTGEIGLDYSNSFALIVVLAAIFYAISINILRFRLSDIDSVHITGFALLCAGLPMGLFLFTTDFVDRTINLPGASLNLFYIILLGLFSTSLSTVLFNKLIKKSGALSAASVTYLIPIVAVVWGIIDHERFGIYHIIGLIAILAGVYLINKQKVS
jgi:drug/metabolite transporter (DMT)-like permease